MIQKSRSQPPVNNGINYQPELVRRIFFINRITGALLLLVLNFTNFFLKTSQNPYILYASVAMKTMTKMYAIHLCPPGMALCE